VLLQRRSKEEGRIEVGPQPVDTADADAAIEPVCRKRVQATCVPARARLGLPHARRVLRCGSIAATPGDAMLLWERRKARCSSPIRSRSIAAAAAPTKASRLKPLLQHAAPTDSGRSHTPSVGAPEGAMLLADPKQGHRAFGAPAKGLLAVATSVAPPAAIRRLTHTAYPRAPHRRRRSRVPSRARTRGRACAARGTHAAPRRRRRPGWT